MLLLYNISKQISDVTLFSRFLLEKEFLISCLRTLIAVPGNTFYFCKMCVV